MTTKRKPPEDETLSERLIFPVSPTMAAAITDYRFEHRIDSKAEAIRKLIEAGLAAERKRKAK